MAMNTLCHWLQSGRFPSMPMEIIGNILFKALSGLPAISLTRYT